MRIEDALKKAKAGDTVAVHPQAGNQAYTQVSVLLRQGPLTIKAVPGPKGERVKIDGTGFEYSGAGSVPRAIFQFDPGADGSVLEGFELFGARNKSHNGAGVRVNQANDIAVRNCHIHDNDMGIMSNGEADKKTGARQYYEFCLIEKNGNQADPGYNHNLYLGGTSLVLHGCEIHGSVTGHNVKSRAHYNWIEYCHIHDSANREFDLVDEKQNTAAPESHTVLLGNVIVKARDMKGNTTVIHYGQDGGNDHRGTLYLVHNTIVTPYRSPVVDLSAPGANVKFYNNIIDNTGQPRSEQALAAARGGASLDKLEGLGNWLAMGMPPAREAGYPADKNYSGVKGERPPFTDAANDDYHLRPAATPIINGGLPLEKIELPPRPAKPEQPKLTRLFQYKHPLQTEPRPDDKKPDLGAYEAR